MTTPPCTHIGARVYVLGHDAVLDGVFEGEDATLGLGLVTDVRVLLVHADHDARVLRPANDRVENGSRRVIACEASLDGF